MAVRLGFGRALNLADTLSTAAGQLPEAETLTSSGAFANFCFGQGELLATPIQIAAMMNTIAAGGIWRKPLFLECTLDETTGEPLTALAHRSARRVFSAQTARALRELLVSVVTEGTGHEAAPTESTAAGKTGTAQTGQFAAGLQASIRPGTHAIPLWCCRTARQARRGPVRPSSRGCVTLWTLQGSKIQFCLQFHTEYDTIYLYLYG